MNLKLISQMNSKQFQTEPLPNSRRKEKEKTFNYSPMTRDKFNSGIPFYRPKSNEQ
jgi:hypothetical protein